MEPFTFGMSESLDVAVAIKIVSLEGEQTPIPFSTLIKRPDLRHIGSNLSSHSDLYVTVQLWSDSKPLTVPVQTAYKPFKQDRRWNEWLNLPISYIDAPLNSQLAITLWDLSPVGGEGAHGHAIPFGGTTLPLFDQDNQLKKGRQKCYVHRRKAADGLDSSSTPSILHKKRDEGKAVDREGDELDRLEKLFKKHEMGEIPRVDWMDQILFRNIEKQGLHTAGTSLRSLQRRRNRRQSEVLTLDSVDEDSAEAEKFTLYVELPRFDFPVVYADHEYPTPPISSFRHISAAQSNLPARPAPEVHYGPGINGLNDGGRIVRIYDPELGASNNPAETKHRRLVRNQRTGVMDRDLKPNAMVRDELNRIVAYSPAQSLTADEKDLVWRFRHHLTREKRALTKFVKSVDWSEAGEQRQAVQILSRWTEIDVDDALELLGKEFDNPAVRAYAVDRLRKSDDDELLLYLLQLVQALKYENADQGSSLAQFLITRATKSFMLGNYLHWYLMVECDDRSEAQGAENRKRFAKVEYEFMTELVKLPEGQETRNVLRRQAELIAVLAKISGDIQKSKDPNARKVQQVKQFLADPKNELVTIEPPLPLPLDPSIMITGVDPTDVLVFKSSLCPIKVTFKTTTRQNFSILFKTGDDLRQDQLVIQIITLMDQLLQKENLDLKLSPYKILATSASAGASQFVIGATTLQEIVKKYKGKSVLEYLKYNNPDNKAPLGVRKETIDTFVKSCAGYCVITYLLSVGDRHLDNLLLSPNGNFFHIDFGFILGRDPKPMPPAMKLCTEMTDGMGGTGTEEYRQFKQYCFTAFTTLRKSSNLILNLFSLMLDANIQDIKSEPGQVVFKVRERFLLDMSEEEAIRRLEVVMEDSLSAMFPFITDRIHGIVQYIKQ